MLSLRKLEVQQQLKPRDGSIMVGILAVRNGRRFQVVRCGRVHSSTATAATQREVEEKTDVGVIGNDGKHVCTFRQKPHGRQAVYTLP